MARQIEKIDEDTMDTAKARALLAEADKQRSAACMAEIQKVLEKHRCTLQFVEVRVNGQTTQTAIQAIPLQDAT